MRHAYRIVKRRYAGHAFDGEGAKLAGGRWNSPGHRIVYLSEHLSLAALELFVHLGEDAARLEWVYFAVAIPPAVTTQTLNRKPKQWRAEPPTAASMRVGDAWLAAGDSALLQVPSAIIPTESNLLLNPAHASSANVRISPPRPFHFDSRMWK